MAKSKAPKRQILLFDLETSELDANRGHILCAAAKWLDEKKVYTWRIDEGKGYRKTADSFHNDSHITQALVEMVDSAAAVIAYYGDYGRFDVPYLNTRALARRLKPCATAVVIDPWMTARYRLKLARNSMAAVAELVKAPTQKTHLPWPEWHAAKFGDSKAITKLLKYNVNDLHVLEHVYKALVPLMPTHPVLFAGKRDGKIVCPACGHDRSRSIGLRKTSTAEVQRRSCGNCGHVFNGQQVRIKRSAPRWNAKRDDFPTFDICATDLWMEGAA